MSGRLREIAARLREIATELEGDGEPATSAPPSWPPRPPSSPPRRSRRPTARRAKRRAPGERRPSCRRLEPMYPEDLRGLVDAALERLRFSAAGADRRARGGDALLAAGRRQAGAPGARPRHRPRPRRRARALPPGRLRDRADPHLLADPRRPAGDGRRRAAPRPADLPRQVRRGRRDPRRRRPLRRGDAPLLPAARRPGAGAGGAAASWPARPGSTAWSAASTST